MSSGPDDKKEARLEEARYELLETLRRLRSSSTLTQKEADAVEAAIEDELIALRVSTMLSGVNR
jgi:hypothetical protein